MGPENEMRGKKRKKALTRFRSPSGVCRTTALTHGVRGGGPKTSGRKRQEATRIAVCNPMGDLPTLPRLPIRLTPWGERDRRDPPDATSPQRGGPGRVPGEEDQGNRQDRMGWVANPSRETGTARKWCSADARHRLTRQGGWQQPDWGYMAPGHRTQCGSRRSSGPVCLPPATEEGGLIGWVANVPPKMGTAKPSAQARKGITSSRAGIPEPLGVVAHANPQGAGRSMQADVAQANEERVQESNIARGHR